MENDQANQPNDQNQQDNMQPQPAAADDQATNQSPTEFGEQIQQAPEQSQNQAPASDQEQSQSDNDPRSKLVKDAEDFGASEMKDRFKL